MKLPHTVTTAMLFSLFACCSPSDARLLRTVTNPALSSVEGIVRQGIEQGVYPGAVVVAGSKGEVLWAKAYGHMSWDEKAPAMGLDTIFDLASVSKVAGTTMAAMVLLEDGKLSLDDRVSKHIPGFGAGKEEVTVRDLLTHVSGLQPYENYSTVEKTRKEGESTADALIRHYCALPPAYPPRQQERYSCLNMQTMARVVENCAGERMEDLLKRRVYGRLGMTDTGYVLSARQKAKCAPTAKRKDGSLIQGVVHDPLANYHGSVEHCPGNAGLFSTGPDLARLCRMILASGTLDGVRVFTPGTIARMTADHSPASLKGKRALGWGIYTSGPFATPLNDEPGSYMLGHTGFTGTFLWMDQRTRSFVVLLTNYVLPGGARSGKDAGLAPLRMGLVRAVMSLQPEYAEFLKSQPVRK